jgi:hypothetical protein
MIDFEYAAFWKHCRDQLGDPTDDLQVHVFDADYRAMKYDRSRERVPFLHRSMEARRIPDADPITSRSPSAALGTFLVFDRSKKIARKKCMFFVVPSSYDREGFAPVVTADHFTFLQNYDVPERKRLQLHFTHYLPDRNPERGGAVRDANHLPLRFEMPEDASEFASSVIVNAEASRHSASLFELFRRSYVFTTRSAGGGKAGKKQQQRRRRDRRPEQGGGGGFDDLWRDLPIHRIVMFSMGGCLTVCITDRFKRDRAGAMSHAYVLRTGNGGFALDACAQVAQRMAGRTWESFRDADENELRFD